MAIYHLFLLTVLPVCLAQFSIQGPSDGNRRAQGLKYSKDKGIEYSEQRESLGAGDFSIQGASDGNSDFRIQGASDGNADFQIQGATDGNADFHIQGATDGNSDFRIQGATDGNANFQIQGATDGHESFRIQSASNGYEQSPIVRPDSHPAVLQNPSRYEDPRGSKSNLRAYSKQQYVPRPVQPAYNPAPEYQQAPNQQPAHGVQQASAPAARTVKQKIVYSPFQSAPSQIKQLLQFQSQIPYLNAIPEHLRYEQLIQTQAPVQQPQLSQAETPVQEPPQEAPQYRSKPQRRPRPRRQVEQQQHHQQGQQPQQQQQQQQYSRRPPPAPEAVPNYSPNPPPEIQKLIQFLQQIPYENGIPEQFRYNLDKTPVPVPPQGVHQRSKRQAQQHQQKQQQAAPQQQQQYRRIPAPAPEILPQYSTNPPAQIQQLLQFQAQIPYQSAIPEQFRYNLDKAPAPASSQVTHQRAKRQAQSQQSKQQQAAPQQQYRRIPEPAPEVLPHYSTNTPANIQQLLQFQAQIPYQSAIPEQFRYNLDKAPAPASSQVTHQRAKRQAQSQQSKQQQAAPQQQYRRIPEPAPEVLPHYSTNTPANIQQLLQFQAQIPYQNAIPEQFRYNLEQAPAQSHSPQSPQGGHRRSKRQEPKSLQPQYRGIAQPAVEPQPRYLTNLPQNIKQILQFQSQTPYNIIANQINYRLDKPYVPQRVASSPPNLSSPNFQNQGHSNVRPANEAR